MGTSKRYAAHYDQLMSQRVADAAMTGEPESLTDQELQLDVQPLTKSPVPIEAVAWVRYGKVPVQVPVRIVAWTPKAVAVKWTAPAGEHRAWVWASAVDAT